MNLDDLSRRSLSQAIAVTLGAVHLRRQQLVTSGRGQPTMSIQAPAFRAGEHIARFAKRGEI